MNSRTRSSATCITPKGHLTALRASVIACMFCALPSAAGAADLGPCDALDPAKYPHAIWGLGDSGSTAYLKQVAASLSTLEEPITVFYSDPGACTAYGEFVADTAKLKAFKVWRIDPSDETNIIEDTCSFDSVAGHAVDFALLRGGLAYACGEPTATPQGTASYPVSTSAVGLITDIDSDQSVISAEALYFTYGFGAGAEGHSVTPWTNPDRVFARKSDSLIQRVLSHAIGLDGHAFRVSEENSRLFTFDKLVNAGAESTEAASQTLGLAEASTIFERNNATRLKLLGYQHFEQSCAFLPDSSRTRADKAHVRSGQYALWYQNELLTRVGAHGDPLHPDVARLVSWLSGAEEPPPEVDVVRAAIVGGDIPQCAMHVRRIGRDASALESYAPPLPCDGAFEKLATGSTSHAACTKSSECEGTQVCRFGYCEAY